MKLYILSICCNEGNYTPKVFNTMKEAKKELHLDYDNAVYERDCQGEIVCEYDIFDHNLYDESFEVVYSDDTFLKETIYEVDIASPSKTLPKSTMTDEELENTEFAA